MSTETFGRLGKPAMALLNRLSEYALAGDIVFKDAVVVNALREFYVGSCRVCALAFVSGNAFCAGDGIPIFEMN